MGRFRGGFPNSSIAVRLELISGNQPIEMWPISGGFPFPVRASDDGGKFPPPAASGGHQQLFKPSTPALKAHATDSDN